MTYVRTHALTVTTVTSRWQQQSPIRLRSKRKNGTMLNITGISFSRDASMFFTR